MEDFIQRLKQLLSAEYVGSELEIEINGFDRIGGLFTWPGFEGLDQVERQRNVWKFIRESLTPDEQRQIAAILTMTPEEMAWARQG